MAATTPTPKSSELAEQLARVALGDHAALRRVYEMTSSHLFGVALRILGRRDLTEEVIQDAFVNVWNHAGSYRVAQSQPMTWLISIVRNKALDVVRSAVVRRETEMPTDEEGEVTGPYVLAHTPLGRASESVDYPLKGSSDRPYTADRETAKP